MKKIILYTLIFLSINALSQEWDKKCMTTDLIKNELENNLDYELTRQSLYNYNNKNQFTYRKNQPVITIPVVIHIIHRAASISKYVYCYSFFRPFSQRYILRLPLSP